LREDTQRGHIYRERELYRENERKRKSERNIP